MAVSDAQTKRRSALIILLTSLVSLSLFSTDIYLASLPAMANYFATSVSKVQMTLSSYMIGFALSMLLCGAISDRWGRRPVVLVGTATHFVATLVCLASSSIEVLIVARFFQALGGCCGTVIGRVVVRDLYRKEECVQVLSYLATGMSLAPAIAPILGGYLQTYYGWKASFVALAFVSGAIFTTAYFILDESIQQKSREALKLSRLLRNFATVLQSRLFWGYTLTITFAWCGYFGFITGSSYVFIRLLEITPESYGLIYAFAVFGYLMGTYIAGKLASRLDIRDSVALGATIAFLGGALLLLWNSFEELSVLGIIVPMAIYLFGIGIIMPNAQTAATDPFPTLIGCAASLLYFTEMISGAGAGAIVGLLENGGHRVMVNVTAASSALLFIVFFLTVRRTAAPKPV